MVCPFRTPVIAMASFGRSLKPPSYLSTMGRRPGMPGRSMSNNSEASSAPSSPGDFSADEILYSPKASPNPTSSSLSRRTGDVHLKVPGTCVAFCIFLLPFQFPWTMRNDYTQPFTRFPWMVVCSLYLLLRVKRPVHSNRTP